MVATTAIEAERGTVREHRMRPSVSCIMATADRSHFVSQALRCFDRQTYESRELVVVDDGERSVRALCEDRDNVKYIRLDQHLNLGLKLNLGIEAASGALLQKIDDDDYYGADFLESAVNCFTTCCREPRRDLVAWGSFLVLLVGERQLRFSGRGWAAGGTLCFARELWLKSPFRNLPQAVDSNLLRDARARIHRIDEVEQYMLVRHGGNTWRTTRGAVVDDWFRRCRGSAVRLESVVDKESLSFYRGLGDRKPG